MAEIYVVLMAVNLIVQTVIVKEIVKFMLVVKKINHLLALGKILTIYVEIVFVVQMEKKAIALILDLMILVQAPYHSVVMVK